MKPGCNVCGLKNHTTEECRRKEFCEMCGFANHNIFECKREPLWNMGPELCAAQVPDQSFFHIDEHIDLKTSKDRSSTAIITVVHGELTAKQIEAEFCNIISHEYWKWSAKAITKNKFAMRFPNAKMVQEYSNFKLGVKEGNELMTIEPWKSSMGAKGQLQQAWFKVRGIPIDQRSIRTIAKIGGMVGKTVAIDERTRFNHEFVRVKISCRYLTQVPSSTECNLAMFIYDFFFDLEPSEQQKAADIKMATKVGESDEQLTPKKMRTENSIRPRSAGLQKEKRNEDIPRGSGKNPCQDSVTTFTKFGSAPGKMINADKFRTESMKGKEGGVNDMGCNRSSFLPDEDTIPAATYEPSHDLEKEESTEDSNESGGFADQVNKMFKGGGGPSGSNETHWLVTNLSEQEVDLVNQYAFDSAKGQKSSAKISEIQVDSDGPVNVNINYGEEKDLNLLELVNPCDELRK